MKMKYLFLSLIISLVIIPAAAYATSVSDLQSQIQSLYLQISGLQERLQNLKIDKGTTPSPIHCPIYSRPICLDNQHIEIKSASSTSACGGAPVCADNTTVPLVFCPDLSRTMIRGSRGDDVSSLQRFLIKKNLLTDDSATGFYGSLTESAVKRWQGENGVVSTGDPQTTGYGVVGARTRAAIASKCVREEQPVLPSLPVCPVYSKPECTTSEHLEWGPNNLTTGCSGAPSCVLNTKNTKKSICPLYPWPVCEEGKHLVVGPPDPSTGCSGTPICVDDESAPKIKPLPCPMYPSPVCESGKQPQTGTIDSVTGCYGPPSCVNITDSVTPPMQSAI